MKAWLYKWLPIIFGCHTHESRSLYTRKGVKYPLCARCTGELVGIIIAIISCFFYRVPLYVAIILWVPLIIDGTVQMYTKYESTNTKRMITGLLFGYGITMFFVITWIMAFEYGRELAAQYS